jgi:hypothetical protein
MKRFLAALSSLALLSAAAAGCGGGGSGAADAAVSVPSSDGPVVDAPGEGRGSPARLDAPAADVPPLPAGSAVIGAGGGAVASDDGRVSIQIPSEALTTTITVSITVVPNAPGGLQGPMYQIGPVGTHLAKPALVTWKPQDADVAGIDLGAARIGRYTVGGQWIDLDNGVATATTVRGTTSVLPIIGLLAGLCNACQTTCNPATCVVGAAPGMPGSPGRCFAYGSGCSRCVPTCDRDGDGYCPGAPPDNSPGGDCDDNNPNVHPDGHEICGNTIDEDCNGHQDEGCRPCTRDTDCPVGSEACVHGVCEVCGDSCDPASCRFGGDGTPGSGVAGRCASFGRGCTQCVAACDGDGDGFCPGTRNDGIPDGDCDDTNPAISPDATEICGNKIDDDCDGKVDEICGVCTRDSDCPAQQRCNGGLCQACGPACDPATCKVGVNAAVPGSGTPGKCIPQGNGCSACVPTCDSDGDGYCPGSPPGDQPGGDCKDDDPNVHPDGIEICGNGIDDDCNDHKDEGCQACTGDADCPTGLEACIDGVCNVCATCDPMDCRFGTIPGRCVPFGRGCSRCVPACDADADGYCPGTMRPDGQPEGDCDDTNPKVNPGALEICGNAIDDDCKNGADDGCIVCAAAATCGGGQSCSSGK